MAGMLARLRLPLVLLFAFSVQAARFDVGGPRSTSNDDSCDVADLPAATLLLPYFEVDLDDISGETTLFTVTNVTQFPQIARVTLWTDLAVPVVSFNVFLTGYDVQAINLRDVLTLGRIGGTGTSVSPFGRLGVPSNTGIDVRDCVTIAPLSQDAVVRVQRALTEGTLDGCGKAGNVHANATGYATIDVVGACTNRIPTDPAYFSSDLRYDNVLIGDYQQVLPAQNFAQGGPLVHIRAVPEGTGTSNLPRTFYGRFTKNDRRQPLPSRFVSRYIRGATSSFQTDIKIWRELSGSAGTCAETSTAAADQVVFDEAENGAGYDGWHNHPPPGIYFPVPIPATGRYAISDVNVFAQLSNEPRGGWIYVNLDKTGDAVAEQGWMITSMRADNRYSADMNATALGNGCSAPAKVAEPAWSGRGEAEPIAPSPNGPATVFATGAPLTTNNDDSCDVTTLPAATLLLPYFEVDLVTPGTGQTTLFTIVNVTNQDRIARVTLWTDYGYPVITFNIYLTGYDVQAINLFDVIARGLIAPDTGTGTAVNPRGRYSTANPDLDLTSCNRLPGALDPAYVSRMQQAFTLGHVPPLGGVLPACDEIGGLHQHAVGYATIDVVDSCGYSLPTDTEYFTADILYDNVLTGDYQQVDARGNHAQGSPLVHIRAIPEGGTPQSRQTNPNLVTNLERTFYGRIAPRAVSDARQPLPSTFAARWILGGPDAFNTFYKIWREVPNGGGTGCTAFKANKAMSVVDVVTFDENENYVTGDPPTFPATSMMAISPMPNGAQAGWTFFNLDRASNDLRAAQSWVTVSMRAQGRFSVDYDAPALGNGCSPEQAMSTAHGDSGSTIIGPRP